MLQKISTCMVESSELERICSQTQTHPMTWLSSLTSPVLHFVNVFLSQSDCEYSLRQHVPRLKTPHCLVSSPTFSLCTASRSTHPISLTRPPRTCARLICRSRITSSWTRGLESWSCRASAEQACGTRWRKMRANFRTPRAKLPSSMAHQRWAVPLSENELHPRGFTFGPA